MRRLLVASLLLVSTAIWAADASKAHDADLGKKGSTNIDKSLAGDLTRKKEDTKVAGPLQYDQFRLGVELQVASKRHEQINSLKKIISLSSDPKEMPGLLFQLADLYWEESRYFFFEANRKDDDLLAAMQRKDPAGEERAKAEKAQLLEKSKDFSKLAMEQYSEIVQRYKDYERTDEVLFFLGRNLMEAGEERKALVAYKRLVEKYPKSKYMPDAWLAFGEYYFNNSTEKRDQLEKALEAYKRAASYPESQIYAFAIYKQGWCYYNLADYQHAMDQFKAVVLYAELTAATSGKEVTGTGKGSKSSLAKEARNDFVRAYAQTGSPQDARAEFSNVASKPEDRFNMVKQLANLYYEDGKDKEAAITFNSLIKEKPISPDAPGFQGKIVDCILRAGNKKMTVEQVRRLVKIMQDVEGSGVVKEDKDKKALSDARDLAERTMSNLAVTWHNEGKKTRDEETFEYANEVYSDYLTLFPDNPKAYDLRFFWAELLNDNLQRFDKAAEQYTQVVMMDAKKLESTEKDANGNVKPGKPGKWLVNAAYNAVLANDEMVKKAEADGKLKSESAADASKKLPIPGPKKALLEACERYLKYVPNGEKKVEITFKAANIYYRYNYFDEAVSRFSDIALNNSDYKFEDGSRAGEVAANLVLDSYNLLQDWGKVNEWARKFYANEKLAQGKFREDLSKVLEQSSFKLISQLEGNGQFGKAAEAYLSFVNDFPKSEIADKALYNASIDFYKAGMLDRSLQMRSKIISSYPKSEFVPDCIYANAEVHEIIGDFEEAAQGYEGYVNGYERSLSEKGGAEKKGPAKKHVAARGKKGKKEEPEAPAKPGAVQKWEQAKAQVALFNAAVFREGLGQFKQALKDREHYLELWPDAKDAETIFLSIGDLYEKTGAYNKAINHLEEYERRYKDASKQLTAEGRIAKLFEDKIRRQKEAQRIYTRILKFYEELGPRQKKSLEPAALDAVARAHYLRNEADFQFYAMLRLKWGRGGSPEKEFKATAQEKAKRMKVVENDYTQTVAFKAGEPAICALYKLGLTYDNFVDVLVNAPMPPGAPPELQDALKEELSNQATPLKEKAAEAFGAAVQKGRELDLHNDCVTKSLIKLRDVYRPEQYPTLVEEVAELKGLKPTATGGELLTAVQPIPLLSEEEKAAAKENAQAIKDDLGDIQPVKGNGPARDAEPARAPEKGADSKKSDSKKKSGSDEPEDFLQ